MGGGTPVKLEAKNIFFSYGMAGREILKNVSLSVDDGERVGLKARSGFGKTTLCRILSGYETANRGEVLLDKKPLSSFQGCLPVQMIGQHPEQWINPRWKVKKALKEGRLKDPDLLSHLGIREEWMERYPSELSGGELQRICIARVLGDRTKILLADEITAMLDMVTQSLIWHVLLDAAEKRKIGMLIVSHSDTLLDKICTRIVDLEKENKDKTECLPEKNEKRDRAGMGGSVWM